MRICWASWRPRGRRHISSKHLSISWKGEGSSKAGQGRVGRGRQGRAGQLSSERPHGRKRKATSPDKNLW